MHALPVALSLREFDRIRVEGNPVAARQMTTAMVLQAVTWHAPTELRLALCASGSGLTAWDWLKWAPHLTDPSVPPTDLPRFAVAETLSDLDQLLAAELNGRGQHLLVIIDGGSLGDGGRLADPSGLRGVTVIDLTGVLTGRAAARSLRLRVTEDAVFGITEDRGGREIPTRIATPDLIGSGEAAATCRAIAAIRMPDGGDADQPLTSSTGLIDLIGVANIRTLTPSTSWRPRPARDRLRVAIGVGTAGQAVELDIKDPALGGMGPHGLVVGAAGSGKSQLLRTVVLGLAITHPPDQLNFVLVDFKGTGTFTPLDGLPHTAAVITQLSAELGLVDRMTDAINGELNRRMELLRSAGNFASLRDYEQARAPGAADLPALPTLLIVIDDFGELLAAKPQFVDLLNTVGRVGRSLGVHLLLAAERLEVGRLHGLDTYLSYRIGLKTRSEAQSRVVLGAPDAFELPAAPGNGYLKFDTTGLVRFKSAFVSGPVRDPRVGADDDHGWVDPQTFRLAVPRRAKPAAPAPAASTAESAGQDDAADGRAPGQSLVEVAVARLSGSGVPAHEVWLPPLKEPPSLDLLLPRGSVRVAENASADPAQRAPESARPTAFLQVPLGWVDKPYAQTRELLTVDMSGAAGHVAIVGAPQSGKSTALRSLICALALTHSPGEIGMYCLDFGGGSLASLAGLPQIGVVAGRWQPDLARRTVAMVDGLLNQRVAAFAAAGITSLHQWRAGVAAGTVAADGFGDVILVVDGWAALAQSVRATAVRRATTGADQRPRRSRTGARHSPGADGRPVAGHPSGVAGPDRHPDRTAARRPARLGRQPGTGCRRPRQPPRPRVVPGWISSADRRAQDRRAPLGRRAGGRNGRPGRRHRGPVGGPARPCGAVAGDAMTEPKSPASAHAGRHRRRFLRHTGGRPDVRAGAAPVMRNGDGTRRARVRQPCCPLDPFGARRPRPLAPIRSSSADRC